MNQNDISTGKSEISLINSVKGFESSSFAILYSPRKCCFAIFDGTKFVDENSKEIDVSLIYEARVFNAEKELRWLSDGRFEILTDESLKKESGFVDRIPQKYLLWGQSTNKVKGNWTQFAEARIGAFYIPIKVDSANKYAQIEVLEYLKSDDEQDGNVAVFDERLIGISEVK